MFYSPSSHHVDPSFIPWCVNECLRLHKDTKLRLGRHQTHTLQPARDEGHGQRRDQASTVARYISLDEQIWWRTGHILFSVCSMTGWSIYSTANTVCGPFSPRVQGTRDNYKPSSSMSRCRLYVVPCWIRVVSQNNSSYESKMDSSVDLRGRCGGSISPME